VTPAALNTQPVEDLLRLITKSGRLNLEFTVLTRPASLPEIAVEFSGPDTSLLTDRNGELLHAIEHIAAKILRLEPDEHDRISFDADRFKATRDHDLRESAAAAIVRVKQSGEPYAFAVMTSRERRMLHLALKESGLPTASSGEGPRRFVVLYPEGHHPAAVTQAATTDRTHQIRSSFRRR
jgi:spoIIIJ-associated protein